MFRTCAGAQYSLIKRVENATARYQGAITLFSKDHVLVKLIGVWRTKKKEGKKGYIFPRSERKRVLLIGIFGHDSTIFWAFFWWPLMKFLIGGSYMANSYQDNLKLDDMFVCMRKRERERERIYFHIIRKIYKWFTWLSCTRAACNFW